MRRPVRKGSRQPRIGIIKISSWRLGKETAPPFARKEAKQKKGGSISATGTLVTRPAAGYKFDDKHCQKKIIGRTSVKLGGKGLSDTIGRRIVPNNAGTVAERRENQGFVLWFSGGHGRPSVGERPYEQRISEYIVKARDRGD